MINNILTGLDYDDVLLLPSEVSEVDSRDYVRFHSVCRGRRHELALNPFFAAPMPNITGVELVKACYRDANMLGILHRFNAPEKRISQIDELHNEDVEFGVAIGMDTSEYKIMDYAIEKGATLICIDVANGYLSSLEYFINMTKRRLISNGTPNILLMTGNIVSGGGNLIESGVNFVRVGIGSGALCSTRETTGVGCPQLTAISNCRKILPEGTLVADGGINTPARAVKAFAFGADSCMLGSMLALAEESESKSNTIYGAASKENQQKMNKKIKSVEGISINIDIELRAPLKTLMNLFYGGIASACTYLNCDSTYDLIEKSHDVILTGKGTLK